MKIVFLSAYSGLVYRGIELYVHELANKLVEHGHKIVVIQNGKEIKGAKYKTITIGIHYDKNTRSYSYVPPFFNYLSRYVYSFTKKAIPKLEPDIEILIATGGRWQSILCKLWAKKHGVKIIIPGQSGPGFDDVVNLWTFPDTFIPLTKYQKKWAKSRNPFVRLYKIPNGVNLSKFNARVEPLQIDLPKPVILHVGALVFWKGQKQTIKAVSKLKKGSLLIVGKGEDKRKLDELGKKYLPGRYKIMNVKFAEMPKVYASADLFTFPTASWESFGIVLVEAMASGLPVVASNDPIRREIVGTAGLFVDPNNTVEYSKALESALAKDWGNKPRSQAEKFSWDKIAQDYEKLFTQLSK